MRRALPPPSPGDGHRKATRIPMEAGIRVEAIAWGGGAATPVHTAPGGSTCFPPGEGRGRESLTRPRVFAPSARAGQRPGRRRSAQKAGEYTMIEIASRERPQLPAVDGRAGNLVADKVLPVTELQPPAPRPQVGKTHSSPMTASSGDLASPLNAAAAREAGAAAPWRTPGATLRDGSAKNGEAECDRKCVHVTAAVAAPAAPIAAHRALPPLRESISRCATCGPSGRGARGGRAILEQSCGVSVDLLG